MGETSFLPAGQAQGPAPGRLQMGKSFRITLMCRSGAILIIQFMNVHVYNAMKSDSL